MIFIILLILSYCIININKQTTTFSLMEGFVYIYSVFSIFSITFFKLGLSFHLLVISFTTVLVVGIAWNIYRILKKKEYKKHNILSINRPLFKRNKAWMFFWVIVTFQLLRVGIFQPESYRDSKTYIAIVNDIIQMDRFFVIDDYSGALITSDLLHKKYISSTWYTFEAYLSSATGLHPLIVINTILPIALIVLTYIIWYMIAKELFQKETEKVPYFMLISSFLFEIAGDDVNHIFLVWPTWGKNLTAMIFLPLMLYAFLNTNNRFLEGNDVIFMLAVMFAGCAATNMGFVMMPIILTFGTVIRFVKYRKVSILIQYMVLLIPVMFFCIGYVL